MPELTRQMVQAGLAAHFALKDAGPSTAKDPEAHVRVIAEAVLALDTDGARWRKLVSDTNKGHGCEHPCLRDDLGDWCHAQGFNPWEQADMMEGGQG